MGEGILHFWRDLIEVDPGDEVVSFEQFQSIGEDGITDVLEVVLDELEAVVPLLDAKQHIAEPAFAYEVEQFVQAAFFFQEGLVAKVGGTGFTLCHVFDFFELNGRSGRQSKQAQT